MQQADIGRKQGLTSLSTKIADLQHLVTFPSTRPSNITSSPRLISSPSPSPSQLPPHPSQSPGRDHFSADARSFVRTVSAPAASGGFFKGVNSGASTLGVPRGSFARVPSGLSGNPALLDSPTITEASDDAEQDLEQNTRDEETTVTVAVTASPLMDTLSPRPRQIGSARSFGRSHTRAVLPTAPIIAESSKGPVIWLQHNQLSR